MNLMSKHTNPDHTVDFPRTNESRMPAHRDNTFDVFAELVANLPEPDRILKVGDAVLLQAPGESLDWYHGTVYENVGTIPMPGMPGEVLDNVYVIVGPTVVPNQWHLAQDALFSTDGVPMTKGICVVDDHTLDMLRLFAASYEAHQALHGLGEGDLT